MTNNMHSNGGVGLAANQIGVPYRLFVTGAGGFGDLAFVNPCWTPAKGAKQYRMWEGCLSVPGIREEVSRWDRVTVSARNSDLEVFEVEAEGLLAQCIQHEVEHLDGKIFLDQLSSTKVKNIKRRLEMNERIKAATASAGAYAGPCPTCVGGRATRSATDVTADIEALLGPIPAQCRR